MAPPGERYRRRADLRDLALVQHNLKKIATFLKDQFTAEAQILVRKGDRTPRARDNDWKNANTGSVPDRVIPIIGSHLEQPPQTS